MCNSLLLRCEVHKKPKILHLQQHYNAKLEQPYFKRNIFGELNSTHNWNVSLKLGDHVDCFVFVTNFLFLSAKWGPIKLISTNGLNV